MDMQIAVRRATPQDIDWLIEQLKAFSRFFGTKKSLLGDEEYAREGLLMMMQTHLVLVAEHAKHGLVGLIAGIITPHMFNPTIRLLAETFWWVPEEHRGSRAGLLLLNEFLRWGKENADWITFALEASSPVSEKTLTKRGFHLHERAYLMEVT